MSDADAVKPFRSSIRHVLPEWIDYNGHLNMAYYNVLFDNAVDEFFLEIGLGPDYVERLNASFFTVEAHLCYHRELSVEAPVYVESRLLDFDDKRLHAYQELFHADEHWLSATSEQLYLHVDMNARKTAPWPDAIREKMAALKSRHDEMPRPERSGRSIGIVRKTDS